MGGYKTFKIEISKNYRNNEWRKDLKTRLRKAGNGFTADCVSFL